MGVNFNSARLLLHAKALGVPFRRTLTLGRQNLFVTARDLVGLCREIGEELTLQQTERLKMEGDGYAESFFRFLGAETCDSIDASAYEAATIIHDLNRPFPQDLCGRFDLIYDGGTLEHIFDFPTAIRNCMESLVVGGHFVAITPANNQMGHGFYQFSPELYYRIFSEENGFSVRCMYLCENQSPYQFFRVSDPHAVRSRVLLRNFRETHLLFVARREQARPIFATPPQQSDYSVSWNEGSACNSGLADVGRKASLSRRLLPDSVKALLRPAYMLSRDLPLLSPKRRMPARFYAKVQHRPNAGGQWP